MKKFYFVVVGENIVLERGALPIVGFVAPRLIREKSEQQAIQRLKIELLKQWKSHFNQGNRAGTPKLDIVMSHRIKNPFKRLKLENEFHFYSDNEEKSELIDRSKKMLKRWFVMR